MTDADFPALFRVADRASIEAQRSYIRLVKADLALLVVGAGLSALALVQATAGWVALAGAIAVLLSLVSTIWIWLGQPEKVWYGARAIAESVKTLTWRYITCAEPFLHDLKVEKADELFLTSLQDVMQEREELVWKVGNKGSDQDEVTEKMRAIRGNAAGVRKEIYIRSRINDQRDWYSKKANENQQSQGRWFTAVIAAQVLAVVSGFAIFKWPDSPLNPTGVFVALAAVCLAWIQVKRFQELAQSYSVAATELGTIAAKAVHVTGDEELSTFVADAENAVSREHTLWVARRDRV